VIGRYRDGQISENFFRRTPAAAAAAAATTTTTTTTTNNNNNTRDNVYGAVVMIKSLRATAQFTWWMYECRKAPSDC